MHRGSTTGFSTTPSQTGPLSYPQTTDFSQKRQGEISWMTSMTSGTGSEIQPLWMGSCGRLGTMNQGSVVQTQLPIREIL